MNGITNVIPVNAGIYTYTGKQKLYKGLHDENYTIVGQDENPYDEVNVYSIKDLLLTRALETIDFLKMDCEGAEYDAIYNTDEKILSLINVISMEFHDVKKEGVHEGLECRACSHAGVEQIASHGVGQRGRVELA